MLGKFFVITINYKGGIKTDAIQQALGSHDWLRFSSNTYYVYSYLLDATMIYNIVRPVLDPKDDILVVEANVANRHGWASQVAVNWLKKARS